MHFVLFHLSCVVVTMATYHHVIHPGEIITEIKFIREINIIVVEVEDVVMRTLGRKTVC